MLTNIHIHVSVIKEDKRLSGRQSLTKSGYIIQDMNIIALDKTLKE